jgi:hypothetical protein
MSHVITDTPISSLRRVCRSWNSTINNLMYDEITKISPALTLLMRCHALLGEIDNFEIPLQRNCLTNKCRIEFFPRIDNTLDEQLFVDSYKNIEFYLLYKIGKKDLRKEEITRFNMKCFKFDSSIVNSNSVIDLDLAFQYIPYEPLTFRVKEISFSPIYLVNLFNIKNRNYLL